MVWGGGTDDQTEYRGEWKDGKANGFGILTTNRYLYHGQFLRSMRHGKGKQRWLDFDLLSYEGDWVDDCPEGYGILKSKRGDTYYGAIREAKPHGLGVLVAPGEKKSYGDFTAWIENGKCTIIDPKKNSMLRGEFNQEGRLHGIGQYIPEMGDMRVYFIGEYKDGLKQGAGIDNRKNNRISRGLFSDDSFQSGTQSIGDS